METTTINGTHLEVSAVGFGAMHLSIEGRPPHESALAVVHCVLDLGITLIDTADSYCKDESDKHHNERLIREALDTYEGDTTGLVVATKGGLMRHGGGWPRNGHPDHLRKTLRESVRALGGAPIQLWQHHAPDPNHSIEASLAPVREAVDEGLIEHVGVSNYSVEQIERARELVEVVSVQNQFSLWHRNPLQDGTLDYCDREGLTFLPFRPLGGRRRAGGIERYDELVELAGDRGVSPHRIALAWLMAKSPVVLPIPGASRPETIEDSSKAFEVALRDDEVRRLETSIDPGAA
jgi:aryl-alcohol dehydrogenase-like predicted oxidoreductase